MIRAFARRSALGRRLRAVDVSMLGAAVGVLALFGFVAVATTTPDDRAPDEAEIRAWFRSEQGGRVPAAAARRIELERCTESEHRLPARNLVTVYRCTVSVGERRSTPCFAVDRNRIVGGARGLASLPGCAPLRYEPRSGAFAGG